MKVTMKTQTIFLLLAVLASLLACQFLFPSQTGTVIAGCADLVAAVADLQAGDIPEHLSSSGIKNGNELDVNQYFSVLTHLSMQEGYALDYVYQNDDLGGYPLLYARPADLTPYTSMDDVPEALQATDFRDYVQIDDTEQGYFEYVVLDIMARQFYLYWHANYNDTEIVCNRGEVDDIVDKVSSGDFGYAMDLAQQTKARTLKNIEPVINLTDDVATVQFITFTKWGGFYRETYTISRAFPHTIIDVKQDNVVPYDCGVMF
jgi:hypothetical protein